MTGRLSLVVEVVVASCLLLAGCSNQVRITQISGEPRPNLESLQSPIKASVAIVPREEVQAGKTNRPYVNNAEEICKALANKLRALRAFDKVYYPVDADSRADFTVVVEGQYHIDQHLGEAKATGFLVGLSFYLAAPAARVRVTGDQKSRITMTGRGVNQSDEMFVSYEVKFNPFASVNAGQAGLAMGQNVVLHVADALGLEVIRSHKPDYLAGANEGDSSKK